LTKGPDQKGYWRREQWNEETACNRTWRAKHGECPRVRFAVPRAPYASGEGRRQVHFSSELVHVRTSARCARRILEIGASFTLLSARPCADTTASLFPPPFRRNVEATCGARSQQSRARALAPLPPCARDCGGASRPPCCTDSVTCDRAFLTTSSSTLAYSRRQGRSRSRQSPPRPHAAPPVPRPSFCRQKPALRATACPPMMVTHSSARPHAALARIRLRAASDPPRLSHSGPRDARTPGPSTQSGPT